MRDPPHLSCPKEGLDVVRLKGQDVSAGVQRLIELLQLHLSGGQIIQTLHPIFLHLLVLSLRADMSAICKDEHHTVLCCTTHHFYFVLVLQQKKCDQKILSWSRLTFKSWTSVSFLMFDKFLPKNVLLKKLVTTLMSSCLHEGMLPVTWSMLGNECQQSREHICVDAPG